MHRIRGGAVGQLIRSFDGLHGAEKTKRKKKKIKKAQTSFTMRTLFTPAEVIWGLSLSMCSTNYSRPSETIYIYQTAWEPHVAHGVIYIVNGNALLAGSVGFCTGALSGPMWGSANTFHKTMAPSTGSKTPSGTRLEDELILCFSP